MSETAVAPDAPTTEIAPAAPAAPAAPTALATAAPPGEKLYAGKYKSVEELVKGYESLHAKLVQQKPAATPTRDDLTITQPAIDPEDLDIDDILSKANLKGEDLAKEYQKNNKLTDAQYAALRKQVGENVPKKIIDGYIRGNFAEAQLATNQVSQARTKATEIAGGESQLETLRKWAANGGIPADELDELNATVKLRPSFYPTMIKIIQQAHATAVGAGKAEPLVGGEAASAPVSAPKTKAELSQLMNRVYAGDPDAIKILQSLPGNAFNHLN